MYQISRMPLSIDIGFTGETAWRKIEIDMSAWMEQEPDGVPSIVCIRPGETAEDAYIAETEFEDDILTWEITAGDLGSIEGEGLMQIWLVKKENSEIVKRGKSVTVVTRIHKAIDDADEEVPAAQESWMAQMTGLTTEAVNAAEDAAHALETMEETIEAAAAEAVAEATEDAEAAALKAEGYAAGTQDGTPVTSGSTYYENNAEFFKNQAQQILSSVSIEGATQIAAIEAKGEETLESIPDDYTELSGDVSNLKSALYANISGVDDAISLNKITPYQTVAGYITEEGNWNNSEDFQVIKYQTIPGSKIYIRALKTKEATYQFQDSNSIPHSGNTHIIGNTVTDSNEGYITVPTGATYVLITDVMNGSNGLYNNGIETIKNDLDTVAESITKTNSIPCSFITKKDNVKLSLSNYSGKKCFISNKNLLPQFPEMTDHGVTCTHNSDGSITLSGTADGAAVINLTRNSMPNVGKGKYTLSARNPSAIGDSLTYIQLSINGSYSSTIFCGLNTADAQTQFSLGDSEIVTGIRIRISSGTQLPSNYKIYPQLEEGDTRTDFVAHSGFVFDITESNTEAECLVGYNYVCAQSGVTGSVSYWGNVGDDVQTLDSRVTSLENASVTKKYYGKKIVCFGDSITGNFPAPTDYPSMIAELTGATVYNAGFGGCCMSDNNQTRKDFTMCRLADAIVAGTGNYGVFTAQRNSGVSITYAGTSTNYVPDRLTMLEGIDWSDIDYITIAYGTNDWNSNYGLDNENDPDDTTTYVGAFRYAVEKILAKFQNIKILVITPLWRWWDTNTGMPSEIQGDYIDSDTYAKGTGYKLWQYGDALEEAAKWYHIPVFNLYWNCMMTKQNRFEYFNTNDGTHPKLEGRELMADLIASHMESVY